MISELARQASWPYNLYNRPRAIPRVGGASYSLKYYIFYIPLFPTYRNRGYKIKEKVGLTRRYNIKALRSSTIGLKVILRYKTNYYLTLDYLIEPRDIKSKRVRYYILDKEDNLIEDNLKLVLENPLLKLLLRSYLITLYSKVLIKIRESLVNYLLLLVYKEKERRLFRSLGTKYFRYSLKLEVELESL
ncbi:hypothetical protein LZ32DRAFT_623467 [Colletotrichum eremochloae]|nr:hypothetical protein LZ32DRAFT_623467 [Colletotrichum eremochloae]